MEAVSGSENMARLSITATVNTITMAATMISKTSFIVGLPEYDRDANG